MTYSPTDKLLSRETVQPLWLLGARRRGGTDRGDVRDQLVCRLHQLVHATVLCIVVMVLRAKLLRAVRQIASPRRIHRFVRDISGFTISHCVSLYSWLHCFCCCFPRFVRREPGLPSPCVIAYKPDRLWSSCYFCNFIEIPGYFPFHTPYFMLISSPPASFEVTCH